MSPVSARCSPHWKALHPVPLEQRPAIVRRVLAALGPSTRTSRNVLSMVPAIAKPMPPPSRFKLRLTVACRPRWLSRKSSSLSSSAIICSHISVICLQKNQQYQIISKTRGCRIGWSPYCISLCDSNSSRSIISNLDLIILSSIFSFSYYYYYATCCHRTVCCAPHTQVS